MNRFADTLAGFQGLSSFLSPDIRSSLDVTQEHSEQQLPPRRQRGRPKGSGKQKTPQQLEQELAQKLEELRVLEDENELLSSRCEMLEMVLETRNEHIDLLQSIQSGQIDDTHVKEVLGMSSKEVVELSITELASMMKGYMLEIGGAIMNATSTQNFEPLVTLMDQGQAAIKTHKTTPCQLCLQYLSLLRPDHLLFSSGNVNQMSISMDDVTLAPHGHWKQVVSCLNIRPDQAKKFWDLASLFSEWREALMKQRRKLAAQLDAESDCMQFVNGDKDIHMLPGLDSTDATYQKIQHNVTSEKCLLILVGDIIQRKLLDHIQLAKEALHAYPYFPDDLAIMFAAAELHKPVPSSTMPPEPEPSSTTMPSGMASQAPTASAAAATATAPDSNPTLLQQRQQQQLDVDATAVPSTVPSGQYNVTLQGGLSPPTALSRQGTIGSTPYCDAPSRSASVTGCNNDLTTAAGGEARILTTGTMHTGRFVVETGFALPARKKSSSVRIEQPYASNISRSEDRGQSSNPNSGSLSKVVVLSPPGPQSPVVTATDSNSLQFSGYGHAQGPQNVPYQNALLVAQTAVRSGPSVLDGRQVVQAAQPSNSSSEIDMRHTAAHDSQMTWAAVCFPPTHQQTQQQQGLDGNVLQQQAGVLTTAAAAGDHPAVNSVQLPPLQQHHHEAHHDADMVQLLNELIAEDEAGHGWMC